MPYIHEFVGKCMHAALHAADEIGDPALRERTDRIAAELVRAQEATATPASPGQRTGSA